MTETAPQVGLIMGSQSDWPTMEHAAQVLAALEEREAGETPPDGGTA